MSVHNICYITILRGRIPKLDGMRVNNLIIFVMLSEQYRTGDII